MTPEVISRWLVGIGLAFDLFGCIGLVRLPDVYNRAQAATKCVTLGTCMILTGLAFQAGAWADGPMSPLLASPMTIALGATV